MKLFKYKDFVKTTPLNENLDKSRKFLKEREIMKLAAKKLNLIDDELEYQLKSDEKRTLLLKDFSEENQEKIKQKIREIKLSPDELRDLEKDKSFIKIKELLKDNLGYLYNFVYMHFVEMTPISEIEEMYKKIIEYKQLMDKLAQIPEVNKKFDANFIDTTIPNEKEHRTNSEILAEGLEKLELHKQVKKILDTLPSKLKKSYQEASELLKEELAKVAKAFDEISDEIPEGEKVSIKERVWKNFFGEMKIDNDEFLSDNTKNPNFGKLVYKSRLKRFEDSSNPIRDFINSAKAHLEASSKSGYSERIEKVADCSDKFGVNGCDIVYDKGGILIVNVKSYAANKFLNSHCNHCIVRYESYWNSYLSDYNIQYYIYNFNLSSLNEYSTIGITIKPDKTWSSGACQTMTNTSIPNFKKMLKEWEKEYQIEDSLIDELKPLDNEEIERRKKAREAEIQIVKRGITIEQIKEYVTIYGANINKDNGKALINAVMDDDYERVKYILSLGGDPNLAKGDNSAIAFAKNIDMIKLLVTHGSDMTGAVFKNIINDADAIEFCLKAGLDPNFNNSMPFRTAIRGSYKNPSDIGESYIDVFKLLMKYGGKVYNSSGKNMVLKFAADYARIDILEYVENMGIKFKENELDEAIRWISHSRTLEKEKFDEIIEYLNKKKGE